MNAVQIPPGWRPLRPRDGFFATIGPILWRRRDDGTLRLGFQVADRHANPVGMCHGGMLATFADMVLGVSFGEILGSDAFLPTMGLHCEFVAPAPLGTLVAGEAEIVRLGKRVGVGRCLLVDDRDGTPFVNASATFKLDRPVRDDFRQADLLGDD